MREEITEPGQWRPRSEHSARSNTSWSSQRWRQQQTELDAETVDAALAEEPAEKPSSDDIISSLASQLDLLEKQREQIQRLLDQAQG